MDQRRIEARDPTEDFLSQVAWQWNETVMQKRAVSRVSKTNMKYPSSLIYLLTVFLSSISARIRGGEGGEAEEQRKSDLRRHEA